jgi:dihydroflavonol-4-reductase
VAGCGLVFHVAADYRLWSKHPSDLYASNVEGTRNMLAAAQAAGVERFIYTSTVGCIGVPPGGVGDENQPVSLDSMAGAYKRSKFMAEQTALEFARGGFPVVIVNPTAPMGDRDFKPTPTGQIVLDFLNGAIPAYIDTGLNVVHVRDVALGHLLACEHGRIGERYILGSENMTLGEILKQLAAIHRPEGADRRTALLRRLDRRRCYHGLGPTDRYAATCAPRGGADGKKEDVGVARKSRARARLRSGPGARGAQRRRGLV